MIVRRYIHEILSKYYQQPHDAVVGSIQKKSINFKNLLGEWDWRRKFQNLYKSQSGQWLTPVELFRPFYSQVLANFIANEAGCEGGGNIHIVEIGGGRGTNALCILDHLEREFPDIYRRCRYTMMDASPTLLKLQKEVIMNRETNTLGHDSVVDFRHVDMMDVAEEHLELLEKSDEVTVLLAMEVLDNLPHDKISICSKSGRILQADVYCDDESHEVKERFRPLEDLLISRMIEFNPSYIPQFGQRWIPSVAGAMIGSLFQARPNASVVIADFDYLPPSDIHLNSSLFECPRNEQGRPLITDMNDRDYESYLTAPPLCDILFPTDFHLLRDYIEAAMKYHLSKEHDVRPWKVSVQKQSQFLAKFGPKQVKDTTSRWTGFSPLVEDFSNCSVLHISRMDTQTHRQTSKKMG